ncbi:MAG: HEPN domain-containing protein [Anaerolineae bacterium]
MDTKEEATRLLWEAKEDLDRAIRYSELKDWVTVTHYAQLAIEKSAKALISCFEAFNWTHDPSGQLKRLVEEGHLHDGFLEVATYAKEAAPWHGRSTYGGLRNGLWRSPSELCTEEAATELVGKARRSVNKATGFVETFFGEDDGA